MPTPSRKKRLDSIAKIRQPLVIEQSLIKDRHQQLLDGELLPSDMTFDELRLGRGLPEDGTIPRGRVKLVPIALQNSITREYHKRLLSEFNKYGLDAIETITDVMYRGEGASAFQGQKDGTKRLDAAKYIIERIIGPIPSKSEVTTNVTVWENLTEGGELFVDIEVDEIVEEENAPEERRSAPRKRGPRTRPARPPLSEFD